MDFRFAQPDPAALPLHLTTADALEAWRAGQTESVQAWLTATGFSARPGELRLLPGADGGCIGAVFGLDPPESRARTRFRVAEATAALPAGTWRLAGDLGNEDTAEAALGWLLAGYGFTRYAGTAKCRRDSCRRPAWMPRASRRSRRARR